MFFRALAIWVLILVLAILNGGARTAIIAPGLGEHAGHVISTVMLCLIIFAAAWGSIRWIDPNGLRDAVIVGILWVSLTVAFEFLAGHFLFGNSWEKLLSDYNLGQGRIWILALFTILISPVVAARIRGK